MWCEQRKGTAMASVWASVDAKNKNLADGNKRGSSAKPY